MFSVPRPTKTIVFFLLTAAIAPIVNTKSSFAQPQFNDISSSWAAPYIQGLAQRNIINGYPDGSFRPNEAVTRAQFATIVGKAFSNQPTRTPQAFSDVTASHWAADSINHASATGFLSGYGDGRFQPDLNILRAQALVSIASGLNLQASGSVDSTLRRYYDASEIPSYARSPIAAATQRNIPVTYPDTASLGPNQSATRADVAAYIYQTLVSQGRAGQVSQVPNGLIANSTQDTEGALGTQFPPEQYVPGAGEVVAPGTASLPIGTKIPVQLAGASEGADKLVLALGESVESALLVSDDVVDLNQRVVIPEDSVLVGRFQPFDVKGTEGTRFTATKIYIEKTPYTIHAHSVLFPAKKQSSFKPGDLVGSLTGVGSSILLDRLLADDELKTDANGNPIPDGNGGFEKGKPGINVASVLPAALDTGKTLGKSILGGSDGPAKKIILVKPTEMGLALDDAFQFLPGASDSIVAYNSNQIDVGTLVTLGAPGETLKYALVPGEEMPLDLKVSKAIYNPQGQVLIPEGSIVKGMIKAANTSTGDEGAQFVGTSLYINGKPYSINAETPIIAPVSLKALSPGDFVGNVVATDKASDVIGSVKDGESSSSGGGGFLGLGNVFSGGSGSGKKLILINPQNTLMEFQAPFTVDTLGGFES